MGKKRIIILGAGLAGLSAAWHLQKKGIECLVLEKENEVGGLCRSKNINGFTFDYSGHLLHFRHKYTFNFVRNLLGGNLVRHKRNSWVYSHNRYIPYPFQANLHKLPSSAAKECLSGFIQASKNNHCKKNGNFLSWINQTFGEGIAKHFMVPYNTKFWTVPPQVLTCEWLDGFIPVPSPAQVIKGATRKNNQQFGYNAQFWYPKRGGINQLALVLARQLRNIHVDCRVVEIDLKNKKIKLSSGAKEKFDLLISTISLPELPFLIKDLPGTVKSSLNKLNWNSIFNLNLGVEKSGTLKKHWIYFPQKDSCFFRVGFLHQFSFNLAPRNANSLYVEVAYSKEKSIDKNKIIPQITSDLRKVGILNQGEDIIVYDINDIKYGYPIYDINYRKSRETILKFLIQNSVRPSGRYGSWRYMSMEDTILDGMRVADIF